MRNFPFIILNLFLLTVLSCKPVEEIHLQFTNTSDLRRTNEVIQISYDELQSLAGEIPAGFLPLFILEDDTLISQNIDRDKDGIPETILIEISLDPKSARDVKMIQVRDSQFPSFPLKTNLHFAFRSSPGIEIDTATRVQTTDTQVTQKVFQLEGPVWENDKVGFRNYFDLRNGMDIFGKRVKGMILDTIGLGGDYHVLNPWGMDILKVGNSLGAGSIALDMAGKLYRIGDNGHGKFNRIYEGPLRSEFRFDFNDWIVNGKVIRITQFIRITAGIYGYESEVYSSTEDTPVMLAAGIVNKLSNALYHEQVSPGYMLIATHDRQSENNAYLGMGILVPYSQFVEYAEAPKTGEGITETYYARIRLIPGAPSRFYFYAGWETTDPAFEEMAAFISMIKEDAIKMDNPVQISRINPSPE